MSKDPEKWVKAFGETSDWLEKELELPHRFIFRLTEEDDWSFIIKTHALIEAALTNQLSSSIIRLRFWEVH